MSLRHALLVAALGCAVPPAAAQNAGIQKQLIQRDQQSDAFTLQLRQSQEALHAPPAARGGLEARQFSERRDLDRLDERQLREVRPAAPQAQRPYERDKAAAERRPFHSPIVEVPR